MKRSFDYITASLAAVAIGCLIVLAGCGPQNGEPASAASEAKAATPIVQHAAPSATLGEVSHIDETLTQRPSGTGVAR